jgi:hypothetical protein
MNMTEQAAKSKGELTLKWGTLKAWDFSHNEKAQALMEKYCELGCSAGAMQQRDTPEQKDLICQMIDAVDCEIYLDWDGKYVSKDEAKAYVMEPRS